MGPPENPKGVDSLYFTARKHSLYFVAIPKRAVIHIQKTEPGPPIKMAPATPTILPIPIVALKEVVSV